MYSISPKFGASFLDAQMTFYTGLGGDGSTGEAAVQSDVEVRERQSREVLLSSQYEQGKV